MSNASLHHITVTVHLLSGDVHSFDFLDTQATVGALFYRLELMLEANQEQFVLSQRIGDEFETISPEPYSSLEDGSSFYLVVNDPQRFTLSHENEMFILRDEHGECDPDDFPRYGLLFCRFIEADRPHIIEALRHARDIREWTHVSLYELSEAFVQHYLPHCDVHRMAFTDE